MSAYSTSVFRVLFLFRRTILEVKDNFSGIYDKNIKNSSNNPRITCITNKNAMDFASTAFSYLEKALIIDTICGDRRAIVPPL